MARKATVAEIYTATFIMSQTEPETDYLSNFEDDGQDETDFHLRRNRSDATRSSAARNEAIERHNQRRAKRYTHSN